MRVIIIVYGVVQGVGYRSFVRRIAKMHHITGSVRNVSDGSVEIIAIGDGPTLKEFEKEIQVNEKYGPQVMKIERAPHRTNDADEEVEEGDFIIQNDKV
ncbi:MAG: acylphosphatase [Candidatus Micrarchaeales archaeon]|jgi:acylphosphatase